MTGMRMQKSDIEKVESKLEKCGYKKITSCKANMDDEYEWFKPFYYPDRDDWGERVIKYQIFFEFWNFDKYLPGEGWGISVTIMPDSCEEDVGRRDLELSVDWADDIERVEKVAEKFYEFIREMDKL